MKKVLSIIILLLLCSCSFSDTDNKAAQKKEESTKTLRLSCTEVIKDETQATLNTFASKVIQLSSGKLQVSITPNETVKLKDLQQYDIAFTGNSQLAKLTDDFKLFDIPFMFKSNQNLSMILNSERIINYLNYALYSRSNLKVLGCVSQSSKYVISKYKPYKYQDITSPLFALDEKTSDNTIAIMNDLGFNAKKMDVFNINQNWQIHQVDLFEINIENYDKFSINDGDYFFIDLNENPEIYWLVMTDDVLKKLDNKEKAILTEAFAYTAAYQEKNNKARQVKLYEYFNQRAIEFLDNSNIYIWDELHKNVIEPAVKAKYNYELYNILNSATVQK